MKFTRIKIENFRQHRDIQLSFDDDSGMFTIVKGKMGSGKTNLLNAFTWCLYGEVDDQRSSNPEILNQSALLETSDQEFADVSVTIDLDLGNNHVATIKRSQTYKKAGERGVSPFDSPSVSVSSISSLEKGHEISPNPEQWIERWLPYRFKSYFLFDGERLERFFRETDAPLIRNAIQEIARIDVLARLANTLKTSSDEALKAVAKLSGADGEKLSKELDDLIRQIQHKQDSLKDAEEIVRRSQEIEDELDAKLGGIKELERNIADKKRIDREIAGCEAELRDYQAQFLMHTREHGPVAFLSEALASLKRHTDDARAKKVLPPPFDVAVLQDLLDHGACICGTNLETGDRHAEHIKTLIDRYEEISEVGEALNHHVAQHSAYLAQIPGGFALLENLNQNIARNEDRLGELREEQKSLEKALMGHDDEQVSELAERRKRVRSDSTTAATEIQLLKVKISELQVEQTVVKREIEKIANTNEKADKARTLSGFATAVSAAANTLHEEMNNEVRGAVAASLESQFKQMTWKKDSFKSVSIDENYKVSVLNNKDFEILSKLSAGERLCLSFAFSLTLSTVAGLNFPMVVDTPMGRLSPEAQVNLSKVLAEVTAPAGESVGHQMIMLMTETEYNTDVAKALSTRKPKVFEIQFDTERAETQIGE